MKFRHRQLKSGWEKLLAFDDHAQLYPPFLKLKGGIRLTTPFYESDLDLAKLSEGVCTVIIIKSGIRRFFIASNNPNPAIIGNGIGLFQDAIIEVFTDLCKKEAECSNRAFSYFMKHQKPQSFFF